MSLFGVGAMEAGLVLVIALVLVGPQRFPEIARQGGKWYRVARRFTAEVTKDVRAAVDEIEHEIKVETADLQSVRELADLDAELKSAGADVQAVTESIAEAADEPTTRDPAFPTAAPSTTAASASTEAPAPPAEPDAQTTDPFKALEQRQASERSRGSGHNGSGRTSS